VDVDGGELATLDLDERSVAIGIAGSGRVGTIALRECDRRAAGAVRRNRAAEFRKCTSGKTGVDARSAPPDSREGAMGLLAPTEMKAQVMRGLT
jgi:hypothetical protein